MGIPILKDVKPEDIEDVSERYRPYLGTEFESDTVKRIILHDRISGSGQEKAQNDLKDAQKKAKEDLILSTLNICKELGSTKDYALDKLMKTCNLDKDTALELLNRHW